MNALILKICYCPIATRYLTPNGEWVLDREDARLFESFAAARQLASGFRSPHVHAFYTSRKMPGQGPALSACDAHGRWEAATQ